MILVLSGHIACHGQAAASSSTVDGVVLDPSGARIPYATLRLQHGNAVRDATSDAMGSFMLSLPAGTYTFSIDSPGFQRYETRLTIAGPKTPIHLRVVMAIAELVENIQVDPDGEASNSADENKSAIVFEGKDLKAFSDDDATFQKQVMALAAGGPKPPQIYVNGFSGGKIPPKSSIREIRLNRNSYSALYDTFGPQRLEILTKPGTDKLHGGVSASGTDIDFNSQNPFAPAQPPYYAFTVDANLNGPLGSKTSFFLDGQNDNQQNNAAVNAYTLSSDNTQQVPVSQAVPDPIKTSSYSLRLDRQMTANNTFIGTYQYNRANVTNGGVGLLTLQSEGYNSGTTTQTFQVSDSQVIGMKMLEELRFQYIRRRLQQDTVSGATTVIAEGSFNGGGNPNQALHDNQDNLEFQELFSRQAGLHFFRFGFRVRDYRETSLNTAFYNGQYLFNSLTAYQITQQGLAAGESDATIRATCEASPSGPVCGGASQFNLTVGKPNFNVLTKDVAVYAEDEWKVTKNLTLDLGFRFESQTGVPDHSDPAPRVGAAWAVRRKKVKAPLFTLRGGAGVFYDRFMAANLLTAVQQNGITQQTYVVSNPESYPNLTVPDAPPTLYNVDPHLKTEYGIYAGGSVERVLGKRGRVSVSYTGIHGDHQYFSRNVNAPLPGTYDPNVPGSGVRPLGGSQNIYQFGSGGLYNGQFVSVNSRLNLSKRVLVYLVYSDNHANSDAYNASTFVSNSYDPHVDYGRKAQPRQTLYTGGTVQLPFGFSSNLYFSAQGGTPFNITTGTDLNGDTQFNDRPTFATDLTRASVVKTRFGNFDTQPIAGQTLVPINYGNSPNFVFLDASLARSFAVGPRPPAPIAKPGAKPGAKPEPRPDAPYSISFTADASNVFNHVNPGTPVGVLSSPFFGQSISLAPNLSTNTAANRLVLLQMSFSF